VASLLRRVDPEWLDELPAADPRAVRSRRDLRLMNRIMGHAPIIRRALGGALRVEATPTPIPTFPLTGKRLFPSRIAELGAGDGTLLLRALPRRATGAQLVFVDRQPVVSAATIGRYAERGFDATVDAADVFDWLRREGPHFDAIVANLFLHHFEAPQLTELLALASRRTDVFVACEPTRARIPLAGSRLLGLIGCNDVTRHDAHVSVRAGFAGRELSACWPSGAGWILEERKGGFFSHLFMATAVRAS
jgi:SAM-dependent methyltransferase